MDTNNVYRPCTFNNLDWLAVILCAAIAVTIDVINYFRNLD